MEPHLKANKTTNNKRKAKNKQWRYYTIILPAKKTSKPCRWICDTKGSTNTNKPRTYADILKPKHSEATTERTAEATNNNNPRRYPKTTRIHIQTPTPATRFQPPRDTNTYSYQKNEVGPQPRNLEGGMQELLTTKMRAFELLRNTLDRLYMYS